MSRTKQNKTKTSRSVDLKDPEVRKQKIQNVCVEGCVLTDWLPAKGGFQGGCGRTKVRSGGLGRGRDSMGKNTCCVMSLDPQHGVLLSPQNWGGRGEKGILKAGWPVSLTKG